MYQKVTTLQQESKREYDIETVKDALVDGYERALNTKFDMQTLSNDEKEMANELIVNKYKTEDWSFKL